ncbi:MAG: hypothetical protein DMG72_06005 [Acidobacteria bacterium]|nr:MAG: hypothetical protein DMG72_06005 [Acidobacteriota bacterium]
MKHSVVRLHLFGVLLAGLASPAFADGNPIPWPKKLRELALTVTVGSPKLVADGSPIPWPKPKLVADGSPIPWPKPKLVADGSPIPWPKPKLVADGSPIPEPGSGSVAVR